MIETSTAETWIESGPWGTGAVAEHRRTADLAGLDHEHRLLWDEMERDLQRDSGLSFGHYEILVMLSETPGRSRRMSELADATQSSRSRLSHAVARLEELGWVRREACAEDRRGSLAVLTDEGFAALEAAAPLHVESVRRHLFDVLSPPS